MARSPLFRKLVRLLQTSNPQSNHKSQTIGGISAKQSCSSLCSRRRFLKYSALAGGTTIAASVLAEFPRWHAAWSQSMPKIAIVGSGIAGLNAAYQLKKLGLTATVYEAKPYIGGRILSRRVVNEQLVNDLGGSFININHEDILALVEEFGLELFNRVESAEQIPFSETAYYFNGRVIPEAELAEQLRPLADQIVEDATLLDEDFDAYAAQFDAISVADYLDRHADKITTSVVRTLIECTIRTEYGVEPDESSALQLLYNMLSVDGDTVAPISSDETYYVKGGSGKIIEQLAAALSGQIRTNLSLTQIQSDGAGYRLTFHDGLIVNADYVIIAIPFTALRRVNIQINLPDLLKRFIHEVDLGANEKVFAGFNARIWHQDNGFVADAWTDLGCSNIWEETQRQPEQSQGSLTFFLGGKDVHEAQYDANQQGRKFLDRLDRLMPGMNAVATHQFHRTHWANDPYIQGGYTSFKPGQYMEFSEFMYIEAENPDDRQDVHVGNLVFAGEQLSDEFYGYMNGGAQTGRLAAELVSKLIYEHSRSSAHSPSIARATTSLT